MAHSIAPVGAQPNGTFVQPGSNTSFEIRNTSGAVWQTLQWPGESDRLRIEYAIGSGKHAVGFLAEVGDHLFQSPVSYYTTRQIWDVAPGYEQSTHPDFSRPVTLECLTCHADKPLPIPNTLNSYESPPFAEMAISCDRCHGSAADHLKKPVPGSIINPAKLSGPERDSVCEQCHLAGEIRIPNPGASIADFTPGKRVEDFYTVFVSRQPPGQEIKVISHSEQLALSVCARNSNGRLWCGTCHNPHDKPEQPVSYYRDRCLTCHASNLSADHGAPDRNCIGCHMPKRPAKDGGHTAFTDHRITRHAETPGSLEIAADLAPWRQGPPQVRDRNLALALVTVGLQDGVSDQVIRGFRTLSRMEGQLGNDPAALTELATVLLTAKQPSEAERRFRRALELRPDYAPYEVNLAGALLAEGKTGEAAQHLERATRLDPLLEQAVKLLSHTYRLQGQTEKANQLMSNYDRAMGISKTE